MSFVVCTEIELGLLCSPGLMLTQLLYSVETIELYSIEISPNLHLCPQSYNNCLFLCLVRHLTIPRVWSFSCCTEPRADLVELQICPGRLRLIGLGKSQTLLWPSRLFVIPLICLLLFKRTY